MRKQTLTATLEERKQALLELPVQDEIDSLKERHLTGHSQTAF